MCTYVLVKVSRVRISQLGTCTVIRFIHSTWPLHQDACIICKRTYLYSGDWGSIGWSKRNVC